MKLSKKRVLCYALIIFLIVVIIGHTREKKEFNESVEDVRECYDILYEDMDQLINGSAPEFSGVDHSFIFFTSAFVQWQSMFREMDHGNRLPEEVFGDTGDVYKAYHNLRDLYYEAVETVYFNREKPPADMAERLTQNRADFEALLIKAKTRGATLILCMLCEALLIGAAMKGFRKKAWESGLQKALDCFSVYIGVPLFIITLIGFIIVQG